VRDGSYLFNTANDIIDTELLGKAKKEGAAYFYRISVWIKTSIILAMVGLSALGIIVYKNFPSDE
jgi:hypothetical protein